MVFGLAALVVGAPLAWLLRAVSRDEAVLERRVRGSIRWLFRAFMVMLQGLGIMRLRVEGAERLARPGTLIVANHPTLLDAVALVACTPEAICVTKAEYWDSLVMRAAVQVAGYIPNRGGVEVVDLAVARLREGKSLVLFPEGTRSPAGGLGAFQRGAARVALESGCNPVPVVIRCDPPTLTKGAPWYAVPERPFELRLTVEDPLDLAGYADPALPRPLAVRRLNAAMRELFEKRRSDSGARARGSGLERSAVDPEPGAR